MIITPKVIVSSLRVCLLFECVEVPMPAHQVLPLTGHNFEASFSTPVTWVIKLQSTGQFELGNL